MGVLAALPRAVSQWEAGGAGCGLAEVQRAGQGRVRSIPRWRDSRGSRVQRPLPQ